jgi:hypothetical protein
MNRRWKAIVRQWMVACFVIAGVAGTPLAWGTERFLEPGEGAVDEGFFGDATTFLHLLREKAGTADPLQALKVALYRREAEVDLRSRKKKDEADRYSFRQGASIEVAPLLLVDSDAKRLGEVAFPLEEVDFGAVPRMIRDALERLKIEDSHATHLILERALRFRKEEVWWRVFVTSDRHGGSVAYDQKGRFRQVQR